MDPVRINTCVAGDVIRRQETSIFVQVPPSHRLNKYWRIINWFLWDLPEDDFTGLFQDMNPKMSLKISHVKFGHLISSADNELEELMDLGIRKAIAPPNTHISCSITWHPLLCCDNVLTTGVRMYYSPKLCLINDIPSLCFNTTLLKYFHTHYSDVTCAPRCFESAVTLPFVYQLSRVDSKDTTRHYLPVTDGFPSQRASNAERVYMSWRHQYALLFWVHTVPNIMLLWTLL